MSTGDRMICVSVQVCPGKGERTLTIGPELFDASESDDLALREAAELFEQILRVPYRQPRITSIHPVIPQE